MKTPPSSSPFWKLFNVATRANIWVYRLSGGRLGNHIGRAPVLLLHHVGAKSGTKRISPLIYLDDGERAVIVASKGGTDKHPAWFHNLMASPDTEIEVGRERRQVRARRADPDERDRLWPRLVEMYPGYADYQRQTSRQIPVVVLDPR
jgi:F420H(2)-dependent quinone reductase